MDSIGLRIGLLLAGGLVIAGIYVYGVMRSRQRARQARPLRSRSGAARERGSEPLELKQPGEEASAFAGLSRLVKDDDAPASVPVMHRDPDKRTAQMEFPFEESESAASSTEILVINIEAQAPIAGNDLVNAVTDAGLRFGDMEIFHHYGLGDRGDGEPLFSLANLYEPGTFDIQRMDLFSTRGVTMFLQLPVRGVDGEVACELFVSTAERIAGRLGCRLYNQSHQELGAHDLEIMRRQARRFGAGG